jgi:predicted HAD superfamily Cof-like phosphohydrolase
MILDVQIFMQACGHEPSHKLTSLYHDLVREEVGELEEAMAAYNASESQDEETRAKADALDAICDSIWVLIGLAKTMDLPLEAGWDAVASTNLKKIDPVLGTVRRDENGKIMKPDRWVPPDMVRLIKERDEQRKVSQLPDEKETGGN